MKETGETRPVEEILSQRTVHLICNAHLDPVWLWEWQEGAGEALSTFRIAADFCEARPGFVFCHNEAVLYRWVEEHEPALFRRIQRLVRDGRWHIMGGWWIQPDCNMPSGESFVRQALLGKRYFREKFGVDVRTAVNLDPFGHTRGLVQILAKSGSDSYLCCRPGQAECPLLADEFVWIGYDGSEVLVNRASAHYNSFGGQARTRLEAWLAKHTDMELALHLWGIGDHGGGPSRKDLEDLDALMAERRDIRIMHSTPAAYFAELGKRKATLPRRAADLNPWAVGCYTSMARVKQGHRRLENELYSSEKMVTTAWAQGFIPYPEAELKEAREALAFIEFHDILPGSSVPAGEEGALHLIGHGLEILSRLKAKAFFALAAGERPAAEGEIPILVYNPHPFKVRAQVACEFEPHEPNYDRKTHWKPSAVHKGRVLPTQTEKEASSLSIEWRKKIVFDAELEPSQINRFDVKIETLPGKAAVPGPLGPGPFRFANGEMKAEIDPATGLLTRYAVRGVEVLGPKAFQALVISDDADPWGMKVKSFRRVEGAFALAPPEDGIPAVRLIEEGDVRVVLEVPFVRGGSRLLLRYIFPRAGTEVGIEALVFWAEKDKMLKLSLPCRLRAPRFMGQVAFGADELPSNGDEAVAQKWLALVSEADACAFSVVNDGTYGSDFADGELRLSLLRSPAYAADTWEDKLLVPQDRHIPRQDQGERFFRFWIDAGPAAAHLDGLGRRALVHNESPYALAFFPPGTGRRPQAGPRLSDAAVELVAFKKAEDGRALIVRLFEPTGRKRTTTLSLPFAGAKTRVTLGAFEVKTLKFDPRRKTFAETDLLERPLRKAR
jgi:alpha-mannosidase